MAVDAAVLSPILLNKAHNNILQVQQIPGYNGPLNARNPAYFREMIEGVAKGLASVKTLNGVTQDEGLGALPLIPGTGQGMGLAINEDKFTQELYTGIRQSLLDRFGSTNHEPWDPGSNYLKAICQAISSSLSQVYLTNWEIVSSHPMIYKGEALIEEGSISGVSENSVSSTILSSTPRLKGLAWPIMVNALALAFQTTIHTYTMSQEIEIEGECVPSTVPLQTCNIADQQGTGQATIT